MHLLIAIVGLPDAMRDGFMDRFLKDLFAKYDLEIVKSFTTAARRSDEDYRYHIFVSTSEFREREGRDEFFHVERRGGALYGWRRNDIADVIADNHCVALFGSLSGDKTDELKTLVGEMLVMRPFPDEDPSADTEDVPRSTLFLPPDSDGDGKPN